MVREFHAAASRRGFPVLCDPPLKRRAKIMRSLRDLHWRSSPAARRYFGDTSHISKPCAASSSHARGRRPNSSTSRDRDGGVLLRVVSRARRDPRQARIRASRGRRRRSIKKGLTSICLYEIMKDGFDSGVGNAECGRRKAEGGPAGGTPAVQEIGTRLASSLQYSTCCLQVTGDQESMSLRISVLQGNKPPRHSFPWPANDAKKKTCTPPVM